MDIQKKESFIRDQSYDFGLVILSTCKYLRTDKKETILSDSLQRVGTAVGATVAAALGGRDRAIHRPSLHKAERQAQQSLFWLRLLMDSRQLEKAVGQPLLLQCEEILLRIGKLLKTTQPAHKLEAIGDEC